MSKAVPGATAGAPSQDNFRERMEEQCDQVEQYRQAVRHNEGRILTRDEAALEWVERFAEDFARGRPGQA